MASIKKAPKKGTRRVQSVKTLDCGRCGYQQRILYTMQRTKSTSVLFVVV